MKHTAAIPKGRTNGFALVVTLSLMILLTIVAVGLLSLASISLRASAQGDAMATARANARLSLMLALGELQRQTGPDTRVTARADILADSNPPVLGAWKSWEGTNHETTGPLAGRPISPGSDYKSVKNNRFLAWLTSADATASLAASTPDSTKKVTLLGEKSVGIGANRQIHLPPTLVSAGKQPGNMAWWIGGENQKARLPNPGRLETNPSLRRKQAVSLAKSSTVLDPKPFDLDSVLTDPKRGTEAALVNKAISLNQSDFLIPDQSTEDIEDRRSRKHFHDLSTTAVGLLTNTATGGWRKDMSLLSERWNMGGFPKTDLPFFRLSPDVGDTAGSFADEGNAQRGRSLFYPWSSYTNYGPGGQITQHPVASWNSLMDFVAFYKNGTDSTSGVKTVNSWSARRVEGGPQDAYRHLHKINPYPVIARIQWVFSHFSERSGTAPGGSGGVLYNPKLLVTPVITLWNPYNVKISHNTDFYFDFKLMPVSLSYQMRPGVNNARYNSIIHVDGATAPLAPFDEALVRYPGSGAIRIQCRVPSSGTTFNPGQTIVYSPAAGNRMAVTTPVTYQIALEKGFRFTGGHLYPVKHDTTEITSVPGSTQMKVRARFDTIYKEWVWAGSVLQPEGVGVYTQIGTDPDPHNQQVQYIRSAYSPQLAGLLYPPVAEGDLLSPTVSDVELVPKPFLSTIFGLRYTTKTNSNLIPQYDIKGAAQSTPFGNWANLTPREKIYTYSGAGHPHTSRYAYSFVTYTSGGTNELPGSGPAPDHNGYIITGEQIDKGVPRAIVAELPVRPLASLAELTHWDVRFENPAPPYAFNIIGNSDASPLLPTNAVVNAADASGTGIGQGSQNFRHDDFYCANHLLFDDWFFSTITPDPATFGGAARSERVVYGEWLTGRDVGGVQSPSPLVNAAYKPLIEDLARVQTEPTAALHSDYVEPMDSWKTIASRIEVEGMFNVNSTSVDAWKALLKHARNQRVLEITPTGTYTGDSAVKQFPVTRSTIAGSVEAGKPVTGSFPEASEVIGYRTLTEDFLDDLAEEIVKQVRLRGPFLSLAEFVNRQLSGDANLVMAGAIQTALNNLTSSTAADNPLAKLQSANISKPTVANVPEGTNAEDKLGYVTPNAATGYSAYGVPGWTRQADILRPIAPILSARDDTFTIRGYGDARNASGTVVIAKAVCEAVVRRTREYVDPADVADTTLPLTSDANKKFGRRYEIVSFRWLTPDEV